MRTYDANYFLSFIDQETVDLFFSIIKRIQNMHLSDLERALVAPMIVMQSGRLARLSPFFLLFQEMSRSNHWTSGNCFVTFSSKCLCFQIAELCKTDQGRKKCAEQRVVYLKAFHRALCRERPDQKALQTLGESLDILKTIRDNNEKLHEQCRSHFSEYSHIKFHKLFKEIYLDWSASWWIHKSGTVICDVQLRKNFTRQELIQLACKTYGAICTRRRRAVLILSGVADWTAFHGLIRCLAKWPAFSYSVQFDIFLCLIKQTYLCVSLMISFPFCCYETFCEGGRGGGSWTKLRAKKRIKNSQTWAAIIL